jgi:acetolactate decarboxylase
MKHVLYFLFVVILFAGACAPLPENKDTTSVTGTEKSDGFYHYSIWAALVNKVFDGTLTAKEAKTKGDIGLGTYNGADGELIMIEGVLYQVPSSGEVKLVDDSMHIPYLNATFFDKELSFEVKDRINYDSLRKLIQQHFPSRNYFYGFKIHGEFDSLKLGSLYKQHQPYPEGLDSLMPKRPTFKHASVTGTMVGFYCPDFIGDINVAGFHLHFLSDDKKTGGHVMEFTGKNFDVGMDKLTSYEFVLPETADFQKVNLEKKFQYGKK